MQELEQRLRDAIRDIPDFPKPGIMFKDITTLLADPKLFRATVDAFAQRFAGDHIDAAYDIVFRANFFASAEPRSRARAGTRCDVPFTSQLRRCQQDAAQPAACLDPQLLPLAYHSPRGLGRTTCRILGLRHPEHGFQ